MSNRVLLLDQLVTSIPIAALSMFISQKSKARKEYVLSDAGVRFIISHANLAHQFRP